ncbi:MAG: AbrB family transcriptional regulator [Lachnospiraceae bacterium]|jgi:membrane AbrB-like protein|nr:AbrB family transcriptional regulator [Lachnospiraceae bacterium]
MAGMIHFILFWGFSYLGYQAGRRLKVPAPAILGPIICFMLLALLGIKLSVPSWQKPVLSVVTGILLGIRTNHSLKGVYWQIIVYGVWLVALTLAGVFVLTKAGIDKETAFFAATPGGMAEITLMSLNYHSDPFVTVLLQSSRMLISMAVFSFLASKYQKPVNEANVQKQPENAGKTISIPMWGILCILSLIAAVALKQIHVPVPYLLGPMAVIGAAVRMGGFSSRIDKRIQNLVQLGIGGLTGASITRESMIGLPRYIIPVILLNVLVIGSGLLMSRIFMKITNWDKATCILSCCPAGLSPTIMVAMEYGANANIVTIFQVLRMVTVLIATPFLVEWI